MKTFLIILILIIPSVLYGQKKTAKLFEPVLIKTDIDTLISKLKNTHPTYLQYYEKNNLQSKIDSIKETIDTPISAADFYRIMQPLVCIDGHTYLNYTEDEYPKHKNILFPFKIVIYKDTLYIKENLSNIKSVSKGMIVEKVNGVSSTDLINNLIRYIPGEKELYKLKRLEQNFNYYYQLKYGAFQEFEITVKSI